MRTAEQTFGISGVDLATEQLDNPSGAVSPVASTRVQNQPATTPVKALLDPHGSAIFWIALAALLSLIVVTGQLRVQAALGGRVGKR